jgi:hypothetical protein
MTKHEIPNLLDKEQNLDVEMNSEQKQVGWIFVVWWIGLTIVGGLVGNYIADKLFAGLQDSNTYWWILFSMLSSGVFGLTVSAAQWILLRRYIPKTIWWMVTGTAGRATGALIGSIFVWILVIPLNLQDVTWSPLIFLIIRGTVLGAFQWAFLKQFRTQTGWWVLGNGIGWMLGPMIATFSLASTINDFVIQIIVVVLAGIITGTQMFWILHQPVPEQNTGNRPADRRFYIVIGLLAGLAPALVFAIIARDWIFGFGGAFCFGSLGIPFTLIGAYIGRRRNNTVWLGAVLGMILGIGFLIALLSTCFFCQ